MVLVIGAAAFEHVIDLVFKSLESQRRSQFVAFGSMVEDDVQNHFDPGLVQSPDHLLEFIDLTARFGSGRIASMR